MGIMKITQCFIYVFIVSTVLSGITTQPTQQPNSAQTRDKTNGLNKDGANVCSYIETITVQVVQTYLSNRITKEKYETCCVDGFWGCKLVCFKTRVKTKMVQSSRLVIKYVDRDVYHCCNGWKRANDTIVECVIPICNIKCYNGGECIGPDKCKCKKGYSGLYCQIDNDECKNPAINNCDQVCTNTNGGFKCSCKRGYTLNKDGNTCKEIDECAANPSPCKCVIDDGVCKATCRNTQGSYVCSCDKGYRLNSAEKCEDINECFLNSKLCEHKCINKPGTYECQCFQGFQYNATANKCEDINECLSNNGTGDCSDQCVNINGSYVCLCPDGKYLENRNTCKDISSRTKSVTFCQSGDIGMLNCDSHLEVINITNVFYGRISDKICKTGNYDGNLQCIEPNAMQNLDSCNGTPSCIVIMDFWNDPCPGIEKYTRISYKCVIAPTK